MLSSNWNLNTDLLDLSTKNTNAYIDCHKQCPPLSIMAKTSNYLSPPAILAIPRHPSIAGQVTSYCHKTTFSHPLTALNLYIYGQFQTCNIFVWGGVGLTVIIKPVSVLNQTCTELANLNWAWQKFPIAITCSLLLLLAPSSIDYQGASRSRREQVIAI